MDGIYILVSWPNSQELMEHDWFKDEAILDVDGKTGGSSAFLIPLDRYNETVNDDNKLTVIPFNVAKAFRKKAIIEGIIEGIVTGNPKPISTDEPADDIIY